MKNNLAELSSLYGIQLLNGIFPLMVFPYILSTIGTNLYSKFVLTEIFSIFAVTFVLWGFEITSVKKLSNFTKINILKKSVVFFNTLYSRFILWILFFIFSIFFSIIYFEKDFVLSIIGWMLVPLAYIFYSTYYFMVTKRNILVFLFLLFGRLLSLLLIFIIEIDKIDYFFISYLISVPFLIVSIFFFIFLLFTKTIVFIRFDFQNTLNNIINSFNVFKNMLSLLTIKEFNLIVISFASDSNSNLIAIYSILDKFYRSASSLMRPIAQFFTVNLINIMKEDSKWFLNRYFFKVLLIGFSLISFGLILTYSFPFAYFINIDIASDKNINLFLIIMLISLYFGFFNYFILIFTSFNKIFFLEITIISGLIGIVSLYFMTMLFGIYGISLSVILPEFLISILTLIVFLKKNKMVFFNDN